MFIELLKNLFKGSNNDALQKILMEKFVLLDVRSSEEFSAGSVAGALNIPVGNIVKSSMKLQKEMPLVVFCRSGNRSAMAVNTLKQLGFKKVVNGGSWQNVQATLYKSKQNKSI